jgi:hypothetical protein
VGSIRLPMVVCLRFTIQWAAASAHVCLRFTINHQTRCLCLLFLPGHTGHCRMGPVTHPAPACSCPPALYGETQRKEMRQGVQGPECCACCLFVCVVAALAALGHQGLLATPAVHHLMVQAQQAARCCRTRCAGRLPGCATSGTQLHTHAAPLPPAPAPTALAPTALQQGLHPWHILSMTRPAACCMPPILNTLEQASQAQGC